ncbi:hypothetical protein GH714_026328 [Hevea brasiliensis]|uniref:Uncharacterized protein n=1 Tax=Hevea brasiliensis TaxID=3981 RepID=A0A6A6MPU3_HEVBR|nr:hypothetical protein GH714_026328 [Hevea brasiliensis]
MEFTWLSPFICLLLYFQAICSPSLPFPILCPHDQGLALLQIKKSFSTSTSASFVHHELESWKEGTDCCSWNGVECDTETGHVIGLNVSGRMLHGALNSNSTLFSLTHLQTLDLSNNDFSGSHIPSLFSHLLNLTCLNLSSSNVAGQVPSEISLLSKLVFLDLSFNENLVLETTSFTKVVQNLTKLRELSLSTVDMASVALHSLMNLSSSLSSLRLVSCALQGKFPDEIFHRSNLQLLDIEDNKDLTGSLPRFNGSSRLCSCNVMGSNFAFLGNLTQLTRLDLSGNNFNGQIPPSLGILEHLDFLDLSNNNFSGLFPFVVCNLTKLQFLSLSNNKITGIIPSQVGNFSSLNQLYLFENFQGSITAILVFSAFFENIFLGNNLFSGHLSQFQYNSSLKYIDLSSNLLDGPIPSSIANLVNLDSLILASNENLTGEIPFSICKLKYLRILDLSNNRLSGFIPRCLGNFSKSLEIIVLGNNTLEGPIPSSIFNLTNLFIVVLSPNKLIGDIPASICLLKLLEVVDLSNNNLGGSIPRCLENLSNIVLTPDNQVMSSAIGQVRVLSSIIFLDLSNNWLNGTIPSFLFNLSSLLYLYLGNNLLTGHISRLPSRSVMEVIDFSNNMLDGPIPISLFHLPSLRYLFLQNNSLTGRISQFQCHN